MPKKKSIAAEPGEVSSMSDGDSRSLNILLKEYEALRDMYNQAVNNGQSMFNYYLTIMTAVFGGIALISQPSYGFAMPKTAIGLLLIFFAVIGSFYLSSLSTNFAHATRYARGANDLRRFIIKRYDVPMPPIYAKFLSEKGEDEQSKMVFLFSLFIPVSTHQLFTATINSLSWALAVSLAYYGSNAGMPALAIGLRGALTLVVTYVIYNVYARFIFRLTITRAGVSIGH